MRFIKKFLCKKSVKGNDFYLNRRIFFEEKFINVGLA